MLGGSGEIRTRDQRIKSRFIATFTFIPTSSRFIPSLPRSPNLLGFRAEEIKIKLFLLTILCKFL
jgi:hypothetical protein